MKIQVTVPVLVILDIDVHRTHTGEFTNADRTNVIKLTSAIRDNVMECLKGCERQVMNGIDDYIEPDVDLDYFSSDVPEVGVIAEAE